MTYDDKEDLDEDTILKLMKDTQTSQSFEQFKTIYPWESE